MFQRRWQLSALVAGVLWLSGCTPYNWQDGPPPYDVDVSGIRDAQPKAEPLSKFGNKNYTVKGHHYRVMRSARGYQATGVASWYGTRFHKKKTSSGEPFNMLAMTAAHPTLPLPTYLKVTNLQNKKTIIVKVNDRGPFRGHRLLDLSYAAAKKLGIRGTSRVHVEAIDPAEYRAHQPLLQRYASNNQQRSESSLPAYRLMAQRRYEQCERHLGLKEHA